MDDLNIKIDNTMNLRKDFKDNLNLIFKNNDTLESKLESLVSVVGKWSNKYEITINEDKQLLKLKVNRSYVNTNKNGIVAGMNYLNTFKTLDNLNLAVFFKPYNHNKIDFGYQFSLLFPYNIFKNKIYFELYNTFKNKNPIKNLVQKTDYKGFKIINKDNNSYYNFYFKNTSEFSQKIVKEDLLKINENNFNFTFKKKYNSELIKNEFLLNLKPNKELDLSFRSKGIFSFNNIIFFNYYFRYSKFFNNNNFRFLNNYIPFNIDINKNFLSKNNSLFLFNFNMCSVDITILKKLTTSFSLNYYNISTFEDKNHLVNLDLKYRLFNNCDFNVGYNLFSKGNLFKNNNISMGLIFNN